MCKVITFLILLSSDTLSLLWTPLTATMAFPPDPLLCQCLSTAAPPHQICLPWVRSNLFPTPVSWGGQAGCLLLRTEHATKHSREERQPMETSPRLRPPSPSAETGTRRCAMQAGFSKACCEKVIDGTVAGEEGSMGLSWALGSVLAA